MPIANRKSPQRAWIGWLGGRTSSSCNTGLFLAPAKKLQCFLQGKKAKVIDPPSMSICLLECGVKGGFLGCRWPGLRLSMDGHDVTMRELVRFMKCNP